MERNLTSNCFTSCSASASCGFFFFKEIYSFIQLGCIKLIKSESKEIVTTICFDKKIRNLRKWWRGTQLHFVFTTSQAAALLQPGWLSRINNELLNHARFFYDIHVMSQIMRELPWWTTPFSDKTSRNYFVFLYNVVMIMCLNQMKHDEWMKNSNTYPVRSKEPRADGSDGSPVPSGTSGERCPGAGSRCPWPSGWWTDPYTSGLCLFSPWPWWGAPNPTSGTLWSHPPPSDMSFSSSSSSSSGSLALTSHRAARSSPWSITDNHITTISVTNRENKML